MENRLFSEDMLETLLSADTWTVVSSAFPSECPPTPDARHQAWMADNTHSHPHREILLAFDGGSAQGFAGRVFARRRGSIFLLDSGEDHDAFYPPWMPPARHLWLTLMPQHFVARLIRVGGTGGDAIGEWSALIPREAAGEGSALFPTGARESQRPELVRARTRGALALLFCGLAEEGYASPTREETADFQRSIIYTIRDHIRETAGRGASLDNLACISGYSKYHLLRLFRHYTGQSVHEYVDQCRMTRVEEMRAQGRQMKEIASALGFSCPSAFSRWCRQRSAAG
jgi:AraC-like DNA-binding protein